MSIITISRGSYSRGKEIAEKVAAKLGYECISRDILLETSTEFNIPEIRLTRAIHDAPSVLDRFTYGKEKYVAYIKSAILRHVQKDNVVYHGLAGHFFLQHVPHILKVRIIADMEDRVLEEMRREKVSAEKARYNLKKDDEERRKWSMHLYGADTSDSMLYDMVIHIKTITVDDAVEILIQTIKKPSFQTTPESQKILNDLLLAAQVQAVVVNAYSTAKVIAREGNIFISNVETNLLMERGAIAEVTNMVRKIPGVKEVTVNTVAMV
jgi:cytidylate kinase